MSDEKKKKKLSVCQNYVAAFSCCGKFLQYQQTIYLHCIFQPTPSTALNSPATCVEIAIRIIMDREVAMKTVQKKYNE